MRYVQFTYVDCGTFLPVSEAPAKNGPILPEGVSHVFSIESSFSTGIPIFYGTAEDEYTPEEWMEELSEEDFICRYKQELRDRVVTKCEEFERGVEFNGNIINTSPSFQTRVATLCQGLTLFPDKQDVILKMECGTLIQYTREQVGELGQLLFSHSQACLSWCKEMSERVDSINTIEDAHTFSKETSQAHIPTL